MLSEWMLISPRIITTSMKALPPTDVLFSVSIDRITKHKINHARASTTALAVAAELAGF